MDRRQTTHTDRQKKITKAHLGLKAGRKRVLILNILMRMCLSIALKQRLVSAYFAMQKLSAFGVTFNDYCHIEYTVCVTRLYATYILKPTKNTEIFW